MPNPVYIYIYIYIYYHPHTDCFVLSEIFSVARHARRSKPGSKPVRADHVGWGNFKIFILVTAAAAFVYIFLYPISYQSAQFFQRAFVLYIYIYIKQIVSGQLSGYNCCNTKISNWY